MSRTVDQKTNHDGFPKARELIEIHMPAEITLRDGQVFNALIENAIPDLDSDKWHEIALLKLRGPAYKSSERIGDSIKRLMTTTVEVPCTLNGLDAVKTTCLISENVRTLDETDHRAVLRYKLTETMRDIIKNSRRWGRLKGFIVYSFSSKYALNLYESLSVRVNMDINFQRIDLKDFRQMLGVPEGKLERSPDLIRYAIKPAVQEVNGLSDFMVEIEPERKGGLSRGKLVGFHMTWRKKTKDEWRKVLDEHAQPKLGRKARLSGTVEQLEFYQAYEG